MVTSEYGIKYAVHLISSHFGNLVAKVSDSLLRSGPLTLQLLIRFTELTPLQVKNSLLILIQHNCVHTFSLQDSGDTQYLALFDNILHRSRFQKFLEIVAKELDKDCKELLEGLLQHGRLTQEQLYERARAMNKNEAQDTVHERFHKILNAGFIERCPVTDDNEVILWRANFEGCIRCLRHKACIENVRERLDNGAAIVLRTMLKATRNAENKVKMENSVPLSMNAIFEEVMNSEEGETMTLDRVRASLIHLGCLTSITDESYSVDLKKMIDLSQNDEVESIVLNRYGKEAYRIFRLLSSKDGRLIETNQIADMTFVEKKEILLILCKLLKDDYLQMEKISAGYKVFLLWRVNKTNLWKHVLDEMFHAALNLSLRLRHELEQQKELTRPEAGVKKLYLGSSLLKLDDAIMVFSDF